ncbi:MAG TPA: EAL domain-containing protein [Pseudolabrys sp.]|nr:EAL domain-containing protein [Pseudolabrys sp.]
MLLSLHAIALDGMADGVCVIDGELRIVLFNSRVLEMIGAQASSVKVGASLQNMLEGLTSEQADSSSFAAQMWRDLQEALRQQKTFEAEWRAPKGAMLRVQWRPVAGGGWVSTWRSVERESSQRDLEAQFSRLREAFANSTRGACLYDTRKRLVAYNDQYLRIYGFDRNDIRLGMSYKDILALAIRRGIYADVTPDGLLESRSALFTNEPATQNIHLTDGRVIQLTVHPSGQDGWACDYEDITIRVHHERALREHNQLLDAVLSHMTHGLCAYDRDLRVIAVNRRYLEIYGLTEAEARPGTSLLDLMARSIAHGIHRSGITAEEMFVDFKARLIENKEPVLHRTLANGRIIAVRHQPMANGGWVGTYEDITERAKAEENISRMARHDALTGLPNRVLFREQMSEGLARVDSYNGAMAVMYLDLDNFKAINDSLGHPTGDKLLQEVASRLGGAVGVGDTIARLGGDEFAILHPVDGENDIDFLARRLINSVADPIIVDDHELNTSISIGIAIAPDHGNSSNQLMKSADLALYRAKALGRNNYKFFEPAMDAQLQARRTLEIDLRRALSAGELYLVYQPQISIATNKPVAIEALLRWNHPERGLVEPAEFVPVAEETGLIIPIGQWALRQACSDAARWPSGIRVAVNLSPAQFRGRGLVSMITQTLAATGLAPHRLELEITEALLMQQDESSVNALHQLRAIGLRIAMDDFGTGYSSLSYLRSFPFDKIKIDQSFVAGGSKRLQSEAIVRAVAELGLSLGIETTAEGIETDEHLDLVRRTGCANWQGFLAGRPCRDSEIVKVIRRLSRNAAAA